MLTKTARAGHIALLTMIALCFAGCKSVPMPKGTSKGYSTVRFVTPNQPLAEDKLPSFIEGHRMIKSAIVREMQDHGLQVVEQDSDLIVAYLVILQDNASTSYSNQYYGYQDYMDIVNLAHKEGMKQSYPEKVEKRAVIIDLIDAETYKLVYRDYALSGSLVNLPEEERQLQVDRVVAQALQKFFR